MDIVEAADGAAKVAAPAGRLDTASAPSVERALLAIMAPGARVVLDLSAITYISSAGLRVLLKAAKEARAAGGAFALAAPQPAVREVLDVSGFDRIIAIHPTPAAAIASLG
jgi:anti-anti-sigma factor